MNVVFVLAAAANDACVGVVTQIKFITWIYMAKTKVASDVASKEGEETDDNPIIGHKLLKKKTSFYLPSSNGESHRNIPEIQIFHLVLLVISIVDVQ